MARFRIAVLFAGLVALAAFVFAIASLAVHGGAARSLGWSATRAGDVWVVNTVDPEGPAAGFLRPGDRLVSLDGNTSVARYGPRYYRALLPIGTRYTLRVQRPGPEADRILERDLTIVAGQRRLAARLVYLLVSLVWCGVGLFIGYARPDDPAARVAFAAAVATGLVYLQTGVAPVTLPGAMYQPLHMVLAYHFFYVFPRGVRRGRFARALLWFFYAWGSAECLLRQPLNWSYLAGGPGAVMAWAVRHSGLIRLTHVVSLAFMGPLLVATVWLIATTYRRLRDPEKRRRIAWVMYASAAALSPLLLWAAVDLVRALAKPGTSPVSARTWLAVDLTTNVSTVFIPIAVAYAVARHRLFDIAVVVRRGLQYLLAKRALQVLLAVPLLVLVATAAVHHNRTIDELFGQNVGYLALAAAAALSLRYRQSILRWLDRRFFREQYDREQVFAGLLEELRRVTDPGEVAPLVREEIDRALHPMEVRLWFDGESPPPPEPLLSRIALDGAGPDAPVTSGDGLPAGICVAVPLVSGEERLEGVLMLGEKRSEEPYSPADLSLLGLVAKQTAVVRENLLLRERISEEQRIRTDVLAHLEPDRVNLMKECPACGACYDATRERCDRDGHALRLSLPVSRVVAGRYRLDALIGRGGMGAVYEALDLRLDRTVAIKFLLGPVFDAEHALRRFRREARAVARVHHPNVVALYDYGGLEAHGAYLVMERVRGMTLREELGRYGPLAGTAAADWFAPLLDGLAAAHDEGIVHRDLKPENVVRVRPEHGPPAVKLLDFGLATLRPIATASEHLTASGTAVGTPGYMSPEQIRGDDVDARSDLFAAGVMVVEALTGRWPFHGATHDQLAAAILLGEYHLPADSPGARAVDAVLQRCLAKDPRDRFATARELRGALVPALAGWSRVADPPAPSPG